MALRKPYLSLDPLISLGQAHRPIAWSDWFERRAEMEVEIGFGLGDFLVRRASRHPERNFVGLETGWPMVRRTLRKIEGNCRGDGLEWFSVQAVISFNAYIHCNR